MEARARGTEEHGVSPAHEVPTPPDVPAAAAGSSVARRASDADEALEAIVESYAPSRLDVLGPVDEFAMRMHVARLPGLAVGNISFGTDVRVTALPPSCYVVCIAPRGGLEVISRRVGHEVSGTSGSVIYPHEATYFENWSADAELLAIRIDDEHLERMLVRLIGRPVDEPVHFEPGFDLRSAASVPFLRAVQLLQSELAGPGAMVHNARAATLVSDLVTTSLLLTQPNNYSDVIHAPVPGSPTGPVRDARDLIEADPMAFSTIGELAASVHVSVRSLEEGFRRQLGTTPMAFLRAVRLERAHRDLQMGDPAVTTVRRIATRWGFHHLGRFAGTYRDVYAESPAETLRSSRH